MLWVQTFADRVRQSSVRHAIAGLKKSRITADRNSVRVTDTTSKEESKVQLFPRKISITNDGVFIGDIKVTGVTGVEIKNINLGNTGKMEVAIHFQVSEVDVQYQQRIGLRNELGEE